MIKENVSIGDIAELLQDKQASQHIALILGSRAGAFFRNRNFAAEVANDLGVTEAYFYEKHDIQKFHEIYHILEDAKKESQDEGSIMGSLDHQMNEAEYSRADDDLAYLIKKDVFRTILTFNLQGRLSDAFSDAELKEDYHYYNFYLGNNMYASPNPELIQSTINPIIYYKKNACKIVNLYNKSETFVNILGNEKVGEQLKECVKKMFEDMMIKQVIVVGIDLTWDHLFLSFLPSRVERIWLVSEDGHVGQTVMDTYGKDKKQYNFLVGEDWSYEGFFFALSTQFSADLVLPHRYRSLRMIERQLRAMQVNLREVNNELQSLKQETQGMQKNLKNVDVGLQKVEAEAQGIQKQLTTVLLNLDKSTKNENVNKEG